MFKVSIPTPCHEDWNKMTPDQTGRHCSACAKSVVDFTAMSDEEVQHFFLHKKEEKICGRFKHTQLQRIVIDLPPNIFSVQMPLWKKFLAACLIVFSTTLFSCETKINNEQPKYSQTEGWNDPLHDGAYVGGLTVIQDSISISPKDYPVTLGYSIPTIVVDTLQDFISGDIEAVPMDKGQVIIKTDSALTIKPKNDSITKGTPAIIRYDAKKIDSIKNPPKADSADCKTIKSYY